MKFVAASLSLLAGSNPALAARRRLSGDDSPSRDSAMSWIKVLCGGGTGCPGRDQDFVRVTNEDEYPVRCCADSALPDWEQGVCDVGHDVWAQSRVTATRPYCRSATLSEAAEMCEIAGGRLCTAEELSAQCAKGVGCGHDSKHVWSSDTGYCTDVCGLKRDACKEDCALPGHGSVGCEDVCDIKSKKCHGYCKGYGDSQHGKVCKPEVYF